MFSRAIVRCPGEDITDGLTSANQGKPDYQRALLQHDNYIEALKSCGLEVTILHADKRYPDSTFVEDTALITPYCAIITIPGVASRKGETEEIATVLSEIYTDVEFISPPGTIEGGDIMMVGFHFYIGLSQRTNRDGADQMIKILRRYGMDGSIVNLEKVLHLKTGVSYLENNYLLAAGEFIDKKDFEKFSIIPVCDEESYAANSVWINDKVVIPAGYPKTKEAIENVGYETVEVDTSEFRKIDGGVSCLSLRF
jgi:dimethylargininase